MNDHGNFLLGFSFSLLTQIREHLVRNDDAQSIIIIEDQYQTLKKALDDHFFTHKKEVEHG